MGYILLEGGAEFTGRMSEPDLRAIDLAGGFDAPIAILPTAAAPDNNHERAGRNGQRWFQSLGAAHVDLVPVTDKPSANLAAFASRIRAARLVYLLGGFPRHLGETLADSLVWQAALEAYKDGAVIAGSSAGAMVLCEHYYDPYSSKLLPGLNLLPNTCVLPHHDNFGKQWAERLATLLPNSFLIGIDEQTGLIRNREIWSVYGAGEVTLYHGLQTEPRSKVHARGETFSI
ncbi:MAG: Type 1 glutamine amidotransferase-like domain-containing protein [Chloroflexi bacterium]|nr:Type 1 glutamine amidotransferase-like domain-containing protein [Chloroflexota bacterium]MBI1856588.1 Type 1 glutamine amidotransferase-like domain-containing protein [Chloroflexota bacterium]MBI3338891.1 Type 1 glutamine amidotransferase-like domain-containing protein [Chloroflexota bacterium]